MQKYFVDKLDLQIDNKNDLFHIKKVMRCKVGSEIIICDQLFDYRVKIRSLENTLTYEIIEKIENVNELTSHVTLAFGLLKGDKNEFVIQKAVELGVNEIILIELEHSVSKIKEDKKSKKLIRYQKIAREAAEQSERLIIPEVKIISELNCLLDYQNRFFAYERSKESNTLSSIKDQELLILIGPEGGFSNNELTFMRAHNFYEITFGKRILRAETAAIYCLAVISELSL